MNPKITMLGTGNALVTECYNTCFVISTDEGKFLVDTGGGNGILVQLKKAGIKLTDINSMFLTHAHTDHLLGAPWVVRMVSTAIHRGEYQGVFNIYTHRSVAELLENVCKAMLPKKIASEIGQGIKINIVEDGGTFETCGAKFIAFSIGSTKLEQYGFEMKYKDIRLCCLGDEPYKEVSKKYAENADWLLCEAFCLYDDRDIFHPYEKHHSTALDAGQMAQNLGVKNLLLYHTEEKTLVTRKDRYTAEVKSKFDGDVYVPYDLEEIEL